MTTRTHWLPRIALWLALILAFLVGCAGSAATPSPFGNTPATTPVATTLSPSPTATAAAEPSPQPGTAGLSQAEIATLGSLALVDDYPLYTMRYQGSYDQAAFAPAEQEMVGARADNAGWACSLFATLTDPDRRLFGRNFDWRFSPALLLFTDPPNGYASVSMVNIAYLGFDGAQARGVTDLPLHQRRALLAAPFWPFDGMNAHGLAVGMAAVPDSPLPRDPDKPTVDSLRVIREMLDHARDVEAALAILRGYNVSWDGGPPLHYLIADRSGEAVLVEFYQGELVVIPSSDSWHQATNFLQSAAGDDAEGQCWRYDRIHQRLTESRGKLTTAEGMGLLADVAQGNTQWSILYGMASGAIELSLGQQFDMVHHFELSLAPQ